MATDNLSQPEPIPCRLSVILARAAPVGVILRRGPSKLVELIKWNTDTDTFEHGQWLKGQIYDSRSDLSPDGSMIIYFASKFSARTLSDPDLFPAWTAISRPPWLTALALWPTETIWPIGGGLFLDDSTIWLNHAAESAAAHKDHQPRGLRIAYNTDFAGRNSLVFPKRLLQDGWQCREVPRAILWEKPDRRGRFAVRGRELNYRWLTDYQLEYKSLEPALASMASGRSNPLEYADWADWDQANRLVFARAGKLFAGQFDEPGQWNVRELADFNADTFEPRAAPEWALEWRGGKENADVWLARGWLLRCRGSDDPRSAPARGAVPAGAG